MTCTMPPEHRPDQERAAASLRPRQALFALAGIALAAAALAPDAGAQQPAQVRRPVARPESPAQPAQPRAYHAGIDVLDYDLSIALPDTGRAIEGRAVLTVLRTADVDTLVLDLLRLRVDS